MPSSTHGTTKNVIMNFEYVKFVIQEKWYNYLFYVILCYENSLYQIVYVILVYDKFHVFKIHYDIVSSTNKASHMAKVLHILLHDMKVDHGKVLHVTWIL